MPSADILRDREGPAATEPVAPVTPTPEAATFPDFAREIGQNRVEVERARREREAAVAAEQAARERLAAEMKPAIADVRQALQPSPAAAAARADVQKAREAYERLGPPPSRKLSDFLAPVNGEAPENTIAKLIQGVSLMAAGFTGLARGDAKAALAGLHGALKGWHEGDKERADRAFADWEAASGKLVKDWELRHKTYRDLMEDGNQAIADRLKLAELKALELGHEVAAATFRTSAADKALQFLQEDRNALLRFQEHRDRLDEHREEKERDREFKLALAEIAAAKKEAGDKALLDQYTPEAVESLAWAALRNGGRVPSVGYGRAGQIVRGRVLSRMADLAREQNIPLSSLPGVQAEMTGAQTMINTAARQLAFWNANIGTFHKHVEQFLRLSESTERGQSPAINRYALYIRGQYAGDPEVAAFEAMALEVAQEYAKLSVGSAQGDEDSRRKARDRINASMNPAQIRREMEELVKAGENRKKSWEETMRHGADIVTTFGGRLGHPLPPSEQPPTLRWNEQTQGLEPLK